MDETDRNRITTNVPKLCPLIDLDTIIPYLILNTIFSEKMIDDILTLPNDNDRKCRLLTDLCRRGPDAYSKFVDVLIDTGHNDAANILSPNRVSHYMGSLPLNAIPVRKSPNISPVSSQNDTPEESSLSIDGNKITVKPAFTWFKGDRIYPMQSNPRGYCIIMNNVDFDYNAHETRHGSDADAKALDEVFQELGFHVELKRNLRASDMKRLAKYYSRKDDLKKMDAFVMIVLSHGHENCVYGRDGVIVDVYADLVTPFNNVNCPDLIHKPKMFFIQACRGTNKDFGVNVPNYTGLTVPKEIPRTVPGHPDVPLILYSSGDSIEKDDDFPNDQPLDLTDSSRNVHDNGHVSDDKQKRIPKSFGTLASGDSIDMNAVTDALKSVPLNDDRREIPSHGSIQNSLIPDASKISSWTDIIISYSTVQGYVSMRNPNSGSWFCKALVWGLTEHACDTRLINILALVSEKVLRMQSHSGDKQSTSWLVMAWHKKLYFNPGLYN